MPICGESVQQLLQALNRSVDQPVIDATGLAGRFDYDIRSHNAADAIAAYEKYPGLTLES